MLKYFKLTLLRTRNKNNTFVLKKIKNVFGKNLFLVFRFGLSGLFFNFIGFFFYVFLSNHLNPILSLMLSYPVIIISYFYLQNFYVFKIKKFERKKLVKFFLNSFFLLMTNIFFLFISTEILFFDHKFSQFIIMFFLIIINFTIQKKIIFV